MTKMPETKTAEMPCRAFPTRAYHKRPNQDILRLLGLLERCKGMELEPAKCDGVPRQYRE